MIPRSDYGFNFWVEVILSKYRYAQPSNRHLQDFNAQGLPVSPGTLAGGLQAIAPLFNPVLDTLYRKQMTEALFHNDETRWEVFVEVEGKVGTRWYLWVTRSPSVIFYCIDPSRSAAVPGAHFAGLQAENEGSEPDATLSRSARTRQTKVLQSLLTHWSGLTVFVENPGVPMDNNLAENTIRMPVNGRKNYYGSGSIWSAELAAMRFAIPQTMVLWGINPRHWLTCYLTACVENGGRAPQRIDPFLPWSMDETRRSELSRPAPSGGTPTAVPPVLDSA